MKQLEEKEGQITMNFGKQLVMNQWLLNQHGTELGAC